VVPKVKVEQRDQMPLVNDNLENAFQEWENGAGLSAENKKILNDNGWNESTGSDGEPMLFSATEGKRFIPRSDEEEEEPLHKKSRSRK
jgi:hypothetical protein